MPRDIPVGNGTLLITFDQDYCLRDILSLYREGKPYGRAQVQDWYLGR